MKSVISEIKVKEWNDKTFYEIAFENTEGTFSCWQPAFKDKRVGDEIEFTLSADKKGNMTRVNLNTPTTAQGKFAPKSNKPYACSYAKDVVVEFIKNGTIKTSKEIDATLEHYYLWFITKMGE